jgi:pyruvyltransferase
MTYLTRPIRLYYSVRKQGRVNLGDTLSPIVMEAISGKEVIRASTLSCDFSAMGSVLDRIEKRSWQRRLLGRGTPVTVWGSGFLQPGSCQTLEMFNIIAVRGPLSGNRLGVGNSVPFGDPGLLFARLVPPTGDKKFAWGIVPHYSDEDHPKVKALQEGTRNATIISISGDPIETLRYIQQCDAIVSSSLHVLVAADCFGITNWNICFGDGLTGGSYKFLDYAQGVGRNDIEQVDIGQEFDLDKIPAPSQAQFSYFSGLADKADALERALKNVL